ncbi:MAG: hypothetical protein E6J90_15675 [Deltaproteobacteria bacterium]|nr:MAG: hypothetical protein E6J90_15675 [Deltaproteobacteria bacterium]
MAASKIADVFHTSQRFMRSVHLERDFHDPSALQSYIVTPQAKEHLARLAGGLSVGSSQRAWRITGDYGCGKSSFALAVAHAFAGQKGAYDKLRDLVDFKKLGLDRRPELLPVLVTGTREPLTIALLRSLRTALETICVRGAPPSILKRIAARLENAGRKEPTDHELIEIVESVNQYLQLGRNRTGLVIIIDELGKFLEFAAMSPERQDIFFLQRLAEVAARSGDRHLFVIGILHQGFNAYSEHLSPAAQREWEKVAGRFEEILFQQPLEQMAFLVSQALGVNERGLPRPLIDRAGSDMERALAVRWYGPGVSPEALRSMAHRLYPLHASVLPVLVRLFSRFGQNERSLFSFLFSNEPYGLMLFAERMLAHGTWYRLDDLYDYARASFGHRLSIQSYRSHWNQIESLVSSFPSENALELRTLKTVAILNLLDGDGLLANEDSITLALASDSISARQVRGAIDSLKERSVLYHRGAAGGFCLWPHTSVNLERAYEAATKAIGSAQKVAPLLTKQLETRPIVARRHYILTGNLRYFEIEYRAVGDVAVPTQFGRDDPDGRIIVFLCETDEEREQSIKDAANAAFREQNILIAIPRPLQTLSAFVLEANRWDWIAHNTPELNHDSYAAEEVSRQVTAAERVRDARLQTYLGLRQFAGRTELQWFHQGKATAISGARELLERLSSICDALFKDAPHIKNELVNRRQLSSAAAAARMRLVERAFTSASEPYLGLDEAKAPPEMSMYLSVLKASGVHRKVGSVYKFAQPLADDPCRLQPTLARMLEVLKEKPDSRVRVPDLMGQLYRPPFGVRDGIGLLLLAVLAQLHENELAFYENGVFLRQVTGAEMHRLVKNPGSFEIQYCKVAGVRSALFEHLMRVLLPELVSDGKPDVLDIVRPLCVFAASLPMYTQKTQRLSTTARAVRAVLTSAKEPAPLLFLELPRACGFEPFSASGRSSERERAWEFVSTLKGAYDELKTAYGKLTASIMERLATSFERPTKTRDALRTAAEPLVASINEPTLRSLCLRFLDEKLGETAWLESIGSLVCEKPPAKWLDADVDHFGEQLVHIARRFRSVESMQFPSGSERSATALRVAITRPDGSEMNKVLEFTSDDEIAVRELESQLATLLRKNQRIGLVAATRAVWKELARHEAEN